MQNTNPPFGPNFKSLSSITSSTWISSRISTFMMSVYYPDTMRTYQHLQDNQCSTAGSRFTTRTTRLIVSQCITMLLQYVDYTSNYVLYNMLLFYLPTARWPYHNLSITHLCILFILKCTRCALVGVASAMYRAIEGAVNVSKGIQSLPASITDWLNSYCFVTFSTCRSFVLLQSGRLESAQCSGELWWLF